MKTVCLIPARGGSTGIPRKNITNVCGRPLIAWVFKSALESGVFDEVWVSTDDEEIESVALALGALVHRRDPETATPEASTESAVHDFLFTHSAEYICIAQATSPLTTADHFRQAHEKLIGGRYDSLVTVTRQHIFLWSEDAEAVNYDPATRPRRQDWDGVLVENGAFYFTAVSAFKSCGHRLGGRRVIFEMPAHCSVDLDEPEDLIVCEAMLQRYRMTSN